MFDRTLFHRSISETIDCWPSFQISISNGMGGPNQSAKIEWLCDSIVQLFHDNNNQLIVQDVSDFIAEILDNEFDTIIEDGSLEMISTSILGYYQKILSGDHDYIRDKLKQTKEKYEEKNPKKNQEEQTLTMQSSSSSLLLSEQQTNDQRMMSATSDSLMMMDEDNNDNHGHNDNDNNEDDGWTVVRRKK
uniref:Pre-rRNA-processing protein TSR2 homolog n=1 Tax=Dermatophagoides pteronyssinus TaxID=6956 RepID=A0A6P6Y4I5_DERPT|nr:pre-rRNA-processing protein TSR2 homolog [Dermatophagoides pteronyssinus]